MKIKKGAWIVILAALLAAAGCGRENTVVTGRYYYPENGAAETVAVTEQEAAAEGEGQKADTLGTDQFMILSHDMQAECLTLEQIATGKEYTYYYTLSTRFLDKYGSRAAAFSFEPGRVVTVGEKDNSGRITEVRLSDAVWEYPDVTRYSVDMERGIFKIGEERYSFEADIFVCENDEVKNISDLTDLDTLRVVGVGKKLISSAVTTGHGELALTNTDLFDGSW